jgi:hypothetical protein
MQPKNSLPTRSTPKAWAESVATPAEEHVKQVLGTEFSVEAGISIRGETRTRRHSTISVLRVSTAVIYGAFLRICNKC